MGSDVTSGGVDGLMTLLCKGALCGGFLGPFKAVSALGGVYSQGGEGSTLRRGTLSPKVPASTP